ncbi:MAG: hypothetical protein JRH16_11770 [Deltaproteobacteria bacterium]|nr:hypothetical protein [Deltaproteobacteria bacterium]MBW2362242.1 hypothetical protein [Deltaproteobacteria bacterium]
MSDTQPIYILDELTLHPGALDTFLSAFERDYRRAAEARGMRLQHTWVTPPLELAGRGSTVLLVWSLDGVAGFWGMRARNGDPEIAAWWEACDELVASRTRRYAAESSALAGLAEAGARHA